MQNKPQINFGLDIAMATVLVMLQIPSGTGIPLHRAIAIALAIAILIHLALRWKWIVSMSKSLFKPLPAKAHINLLLNVLSLFLFAITIFSGIFNAPLPLARTARNGQFLIHAIHNLSAHLSLLTVIAHLVLHCKWLANAMKQLRAMTVQAVAKQ